MKLFILLSVILMVKCNPGAPPPIPGSVDANDVQVNKPPPVSETTNNNVKKKVVEVADPKPDDIEEAHIPDIPSEVNSVSSDEQVDEPADQPHDRKKRFITTSTTLWPNNHIFYAYDDANFGNEGTKAAVKFGIQYLKDRTCLSFTEVDENTYTNTSYVKFITTGACRADLGYRASSPTICNCCSKITCYHEMLHLVGLMHEHQRADRDRFIEVHYDKIASASWPQFYKLSESSINHIDRDVYKVGSTMHYSSTAFLGDLFGYSITTVNDDYMMGSNFFYTIREVNLRYNCQQVACPDFNMTCQNGGYVTKYMGVCQCVCPGNLSPKDGCALPIRENSVDWPSGSYAFVAAGYGCPTGFSIGNIKHWSRGNTFSEGSNPMKGTQDRTSSSYEFCVSNNNFPNSTNKWPPGIYCILRVGGTCPEGFGSGYIQYDDYIRSSALNNTRSGTLPDGEFGQDTKMFFCCRNDGLKNIPIELPLTNEFILYNADNLADYPCQMVKNFNSRKLYYAFNNHQATGNVAGYGGFKPSLVDYGSQPYYLVYICHYTPLNVDCGGNIVLNDTNPTVNFTSPNHPSNYPSNTKCTWLITAPENSKIYLNFPSWNVHCSDSVEVRLFNIGESHPTRCNYDGRTFRSYKNEITVTLHTSSSAEASGFVGSVSFVNDADNCYDESDYGASYRGTVNVTRDFQTCLPWSETIHCDYSSRHPQHIDSGLDSNYCRNPGSGDRPWCYTESTQCKRQSCDVCLHENVHDRYSDCSSLISTIPNFCSRDPRASTYCRQSCFSEHPMLIGYSPSVSRTYCTPPTVVPSDGYISGTAKSVYNVSETITYICNKNEYSSVTITCSSEGTFNTFTSACKPCDDGWWAFKGRCYKRSASNKNYNSARNGCVNENAKLIMPKGQDDRDFLLRIRDKRTETWIGANDVASEGTWRWLDGTVVDPADLKFGYGQPSNSSSYHDCASLLPGYHSPVWIDKYCQNSYVRYSSICEKPSHNICADLVDDCAQRISRDPSFCDVDNSYAETYCRASCGCVACENGDYYKDQCLVKNENKLKNYDARAACVAIGGRLASPFTEEDNEKLRSYGFSSYWIGLTDEGSEGNWRGLGGKPANFTKWRSGEPNNYWNFEHCIKVDSYGVWNDVYCNYYNFHQFVCSIPYSQVQCDVEAGINTVSVGNTSISKGEKFVYQCNEGFIHISGDLERACLANGSLTGTAPSCEGELTASVLTPNNNVPIVQRTQTITNLAGHMYSGDGHQFVIPRSGEILSWEYFSRVSGNVGLMVFRYNGTDLKLVDYNYITADGANRHSVFYVPIGERINVEKGDRIGVWFPENKQTIAVNFHKDSYEWQYPDEKIRRSYLSFSSTTALEIGTTYEFYVASSPLSESKTLHGLFSLRANIGPRSQ